ncbi:MAG: hypothetical protein AB7U73_03605 [Pirellulales bacterium]
MTLLAIFSLQMSCGLALVMARISPRDVPAGFFRVHSYVTLGLAILATLAAWQLGATTAAILAGIAAVASFVSAALWLYERSSAGRLALWVVAVASFAGGSRLLDYRAIAIAAASPGATITGQGVGGASLSGTLAPAGRSTGAWLLDELDLFAGSLLVGTTLAAMLLGHWYLNTPTMKLAPLERLIWTLIFAVLLRGALALLGLVLVMTQASEFGGSTIVFLALRWLAGIAGTLIVAVMARETLRIPNTQAATGLLYVAVITVFLGELAARLLSNQAPYPL